MSDSAYNVYWKNNMQLTPVFSLSGYSRAAESTGFYCRELEIAFDAGITMNDMPSYICLTHLHNDHFACLNKMLIGNTKEPIIFIPNNNKFEELLTSTLKYLYFSSKFIHPESTKGKNNKTKYPYRVVRLDVGQSYQLKETKNGTLYVEGLPSDHGVVSISFGIYETRRRCLPQYKGLDRSVYTKMKAEGTEFTEQYRFPIVCYMSDTNRKPFIGEHADLIFQYPTIIVECTFLEPDDLKHAKKKNHMHWDWLEPIVRKKSNKFILIHFSKKYMWNDIETFFDKYQEKTSPLTNVTLWLHTGLVHYS